MQSTKIYERMDEEKAIRCEAQTMQKTNKQTNQQTNKAKNKQTNKQTGRQTDKSLIFHK
jgi:hypothetical protein